VACRNSGTRSPLPSRAMARFTITYSPEMGLPDETIEADSHEIDGPFITFYDEDGDATHRYKASAVLRVARVA
jgi:hypothetical protein